MNISEHERERNQMKNVLQQVLLVYALISHNDHQLPSLKLMGATQKLFEYVFPIVARHLMLCPQQLCLLLRVSGGNLNR